MNTACPRRASLIIAGGLPAIPSPTIGATTGDRPAARRFSSSPHVRLQASPLARRLARPHRPNRVHDDCPTGQPVLRTGRSRSVALHPVLPRRSYGSIPHGSSPHRSGLPPLCLPAFSGARARASRPQQPRTCEGATNFQRPGSDAAAAAGTAALRCMRLRRPVCIADRWFSHRFSVHSCG